MRSYSLSHLSDRSLLRGLAAAMSRERSGTADVLAHIAEVDARRLYAHEGYPSMYAYCVSALRLSDQAARKRIHAARTALRFPVVFGMVADGRLHLSAVNLLAPHVTDGNADELLAAASCRSKSEVEEMLARRFPRSEAFSWTEDLVPGVGTPDSERSPGSVGTPDLERSPGNVGTPAAESAVEEAGDPDAERSPGSVGMPDAKRSPGNVGTHAFRSRMKPIAHGRYVVQISIGQDTYERLRQAEALLAHQLPAGDLAGVFDLALQALVGRLEKRKFAATSRPSRPRAREPRQAPGAGSRHIPAAVKRAAWQRDGGRCTFVSNAGVRCPARERLEYDHVQPVARGGEATVSNLRLRCRTHNQMEAERAFGLEFMRAKRAGRCRKAEQDPCSRGSTETGSRRSGSSEPGPRPPSSADPCSRPSANAEPSGDSITSDALACLRTLGFRPGEARHALASCGAPPQATLEARVRAALRCLGPVPRVQRPVSTPPTPALECPA